MPWLRRFRKNIIKRGTFEFIFSSHKTKRLWEKAKYVFNIFPKHLKLPWLFQFLVNFLNKFRHGRPRRTALPCAAAEFPTIPRPRPESVFLHHELRLRISRDRRTSRNDRRSLRLEIRSQTQSVFEVTHLAGPDYFVNGFFLLLSPSLPQRIPVSVAVGRPGSRTKGFGGGPWGMVGPERSLRSTSNLPFNFLLFSINWRQPVLNILRCTVANRTSLLSLASWPNFPIKKNQLKKRISQTRAETIIPQTVLFCLTLNAKIDTVSKTLWHPFFLKAVVALWRLTNSSIMWRKSVYMGLKNSTIAFIGMFNFVLYKNSRWYIAMSASFSNACIHFLNSNAVLLWTWHFSGRSTSQNMHNLPLEIIEPIKNLAFLRYRKLTL